MWRGSAAFGAFASRQRAQAEALEGVEQVEAVILGFAVGTQQLGQLAGERHFAANAFQVAGILGVLIEREQNTTFGPV